MGAAVLLGGFLKEGAALDVGVGEGVGLVHYGAGGDGALLEGAHRSGGGLGASPGGDAGVDFVLAGAAPGCAGQVRVAGEVGGVD